MKAKKGKAKGKAKSKARPKVRAKATSAARRVKAKAATKRKKAPKAKAPKAKAAPSKPAGIVPPPGGVLLGRVEDYFAKIGVIALTLQRALSLGSRIHVLGHTTNFEQTVDSMQIDHQPVTAASESSAVGIKVTSRARRGDHIFFIP